MSLPADEFIRRFLIHVLPEGFQRIPYHGFLGNRYRQRKLALCRRLLGMQTPASPPAKDHRDRYEELTGRSLRECPPDIHPASPEHRGRFNTHRPTTPPAA